MGSFLDGVTAAVVGFIAITAFQLMRDSVSIVYNKNINIKRGSGYKEFVGIPHSLIMERVIVLYQLSYHGNTMTILINYNEQDSYS